MDRGSELPTVWSLARRRTRSAISPVAFALKDTTASARFLACRYVIRHLEQAHRRRQPINQVRPQRGIAA